MPFTFCHPAIVLPFSLISKRYFSLTGLIIGSIVPDFEYFLRMKIHSEYSHELWGLLWFNLPLGILLAFIFHYLRNTFVEHSPSFIKGRLIPFTTFNWLTYFKKYWWVVIYSLLLGIISHVFWDAFTHPHGYFVDKFSFFQQKTFLLDKPVYNLLQHASSLLGGITILIVFFRLPFYQHQKSTFTPYYWFWAISLGMIIFCIRFYIGLTIHQYGNIIVSIISSFLISLVIISLKKQQSS